MFNFNNNNMIVRIFGEAKSSMPEKKERFLEDFCFDIVATSVEEVAPNVYKYGTGLHFAINDVNLDNTKNNVCVTIRPRSSIWKTGMVLSNSVGTIDQGYRGEVMAVFYHVMPNMPKYEIGDKIGQIHISISPKIFWDKIDRDEFNHICRIEADNDKAFRGELGYGSTGK